MDINWAHAAPTVLAAFFASLVEFIEALTIVLAVGAVRGWRGAIGGAALALVVLLLLVVVLGPAITQIRQGCVQLVLGTLLLLFGLRWLRKAVLRTAGVVPFLPRRGKSLRRGKRITARKRGGSREAGIAWPFRPLSRLL
jgi:Ca2+/H+ antiporter, TMEM165/GDT1 family